MSVLARASPLRPALHTVSLGQTMLKQAGTCRAAQHGLLQIRWHPGYHATQLLQERLHHLHSTLPRIRTTALPHADRPQQ